MGDRSNLAYVPFGMEMDRKHTGFVEWHGAGAYWAIGAGDFTLLRGGRGYIKGLGVEFGADSQVLPLAANATNFFGIDENGRMITRVALTDADLEDFIWLFAVLNDGTINQTSKFNRPFSFPVAVLQMLNAALGPVIRTPDGIGLAPLAAMTLAGANAAVLDDCGLVTAIPAIPAGIVWNQYYVNAAGDWIRAAQAAAFLNQYNNAGVPAPLTANFYGAYRLYVGKESLNAADPQFYAVMHTAEYDNIAQLMEEVDADTLAVATNELEALGLAHIGYVIFVETGGGAIQLVGNVKNQLANQVRQQLQINRNAQISQPRDHVYRNLLTEGAELIIAGTWLPRVDATMLFNGTFDNSTADANADECIARIYIPSSGVWQMVANAPVGPNGGIVEIYMDGVQIGAPAGYDLYAVGADPLAQIVVPGFALAAGAHELAFRVNGQNMASAGFWVLLSGICFRRLP